MEHIIIDDKKDIKILAAIEEYTLKDDFDTSSKKATVLYYSGDISTANILHEINIIVSEEFINDKNHTRGKIDETQMTGVILDIAKKAYEDKKGIPYGFESVIATSKEKVRYIPKIDMKAV